MLKITTGFIFFICCFNLQAQKSSETPANIAANYWTDSIYNTLSPEQRIGQLIVSRLSTIDSKTRQITFFDSLVIENVKKYNIGGLCVFQGGPQKQAEMINKIQGIAKTPLMITIDGEWGLGMRLLDSVQSLPHQMMLGAIKDSNITYEYARIVADQCKRFGIHMDFAPVVDINNNPQNPVINDRSFGEDKEKVAVLGDAYVRGLQDAGIMACIKHFPGHGDVSTDSHYDLPIINKTMEQLDSLELYPFKKLTKTDVSSVMVAHLFIPAIDSSQNRATSLSKNNIIGLLQEKLGFHGLCFTDALEMQGVKKFFPSGKASVEALKAGNDMLLLPEDVPNAISFILDAIKNGELSWNDIELHCKKVLTYKYKYGIQEWSPIILKDISADLNKSIPSLKRLVAENAITLLKGNNSDFFPLTAKNEKSQNNLAFIGIGLNAENNFASHLRNEFNADTFYFDGIGKNDSTVNELLQKSASYKKIIVGIHNINRRPQNNFGISIQTANLIIELSKRENVMIFLFGNPYAVKNMCATRNLAVCYEDDSVIREVAFDMLQGKIPYRGVLPVTVCDSLKFGTSVTLSKYNSIAASGFNRIDSIIYDAIKSKAIPGCEVLVAKDGNIQLHKAYGNFKYDYEEPVTTEAMYDVASITKMCATTLAVMKLYDERKINLKKKLSTYLPETKKTNKGKIIIEKLLLHEAGLPPTIHFYKENLDTSGNPLPVAFSNDSNDIYNIRVAKNMYTKATWKKDIPQMIYKCTLQLPAKYVYSDNDFILLGMVVERITGMPLDKYVSNNFYTPLGLTSIGFKPLEWTNEKLIAPTQDEKVFRKQILRGDVHDPGAAMMGGVAGHAGLFSNAYDLSVIMQMLLDGGTYKGKRYIKKKTIELFTAYHSETSRRGYGFDKPEKDNDTRHEPYPASAASPLAFGHLGFTGTCAWADPKNGLVYIFLSNRVYPSGSDAFVKMNIRTKIFQTIYNSILQLP